MKFDLTENQYDSIMFLIKRRIIYMLKEAERKGFDYKKSKENCKHLYELKENLEYQYKKQC